MSTDDIVLVQQLVCREREARDRQWWDEMRDLYADESYVDLSWFQGSGARFIDESIELAKQGTSAKHQLGPVIVRLDRDRTRALATVSASIEARFKIEGVEVDLVSQTRLLYRAVKHNNGRPWQLSRLDCIYECDRMTPSIPGQTLRVNPDDLKTLRSSYKCLAYFLTTRGLSINHELPGDDRPEQVKQAYDDAFAWLRASERGASLLET
jgi:hypothetical protein